MKKLFANGFWSKRKKQKVKPQKEDWEEDSWVNEPTPNQCNNCHAWLEDGDVYCRHCGTKRGKGTFVPYQNIMECLYGPMPEERIHQCECCGYSWSTILMIDNEKFCPKCGGRAPVK